MYDRGGGRRKERGGKQGLEVSNLKSIDRSQEEDSNPPKTFRLFDVC